MDHQQAAVLELDRHHLERDVVEVIAEEDERGLAVSGESLGGSSLNRRALCSMT